VQVEATARWEHRHATELRLEGPSDGPGGHPGAAKLVATAHVTRGLPDDAPMVLLVHGYAVPMPLLDALVARTLRAQGAHSMRIDLPFHLRRRLPGHSSGDGFFGTDPARIRATVRQSVEDAAALVAWARANVTPTVAVMGVSLGGLVSTLLAAQVPLDSVMGVAPLCDPPLTFLEHMPGRLARRLGLNATSGGAWGADRSEARAMLDAALAPLVPRNFVPRTPPENITLVRPQLDIIVGPQPIADLAAAWGAELWDYPYGHITVMNAPGVGARIRDRLLDPSRVGAGRARMAAAG
jgi:alpha-beta hydrolase superfamily lysophospholipase